MIQFFLFFLFYLNQNGLETGGYFAYKLNGERKQFLSCLGESLMNMIIFVALTENKK